MTPPPKLLDRLRDACRVRHYSIRTEDAYHDWCRRFILFHGKRHPLEMAAAEINAFLTHLAVERRVAASTQNQAFSAILFLYRNVLAVEPGVIAGAIRAQRPKRLPVVLTKPEVRLVIDRLEGTYRLVAQLLYGSGLRLLESLRLRVKDIDFDRNEVTVRQGKGNKDRVTMLPESLKPALVEHLEKVRRLHEKDVALGFGGVYLPDALGETPGCRDRVEVAVRLPVRGVLGRSAVGRAPPAPRPRGFDEPGSDEGGAGLGGREAGDEPQLPAQLCDAPVGGELRHPHGARTPRPRRREHDDDLHARVEQGRLGSPQPVRRLKPAQCAIVGWLARSSGEGIDRIGVQAGT